LIAGVVLGLLLSRAFLLMNASNRAYADLEADNQEEYIVLVGAAYSLDHDLARAQAQLDRLEVVYINQTVVELIDRYVAEGRDPADIRALAELAYALGEESPTVVAYLATPTPPPSDTPLPTPTPDDTNTPSPTNTSIPPTKPPPTATVQPSNTPAPTPTATARPSDTAAPPTPTAAPTDTPKPQPTNTSVPKPTATVRPSATAAAKWTYTARLLGPGREGQTCEYRGQKLIRVTVLDAAGNQIPGVWVHERYTGLYQVSGHKGDDPFWGPGEVEFSGMDGGQLCIATGEGGACESNLTRNLPTHDPPPLDDLWAAGYCACCEPDITRERCQELYDKGECVSISWYDWHVEFKRSQ
jgi:hypothetical protein